MTGAGVVPILGFMSWEMGLTLAAIYGLASFVQGLVGFAFAVISVPLVSMIYDPVTAVAYNAVLGSLNCTWNFVLLRRRVSYRKTLPILAVSVAVMPLGALFLFSMPRDLIITVLGAVVIGMTAFSMFFQEKAGPFLRHPAAAGTAAVTAGLLGGAFSTPGPPIIAYFYNTGDDKRRAKANIQLFFVGISATVIAIQVAAGNLTGEVVLRLAALVPVVLLFTNLGLWTARQISAGMFSLLVNLALIALGLFLIVS